MCDKNVEKDVSTWRRISIAVDSGACDNVMSPDDVPEQTVFESVGSKKGEHFFSATGKPIPSLGDIMMPMVMREGTRYVDVGCTCVKAVGICEENMPRSHTVVFDEQESFIVNKSTGEINWLRDDDGNCMLDAWVPPPGYHGEDCKQGFEGVRSQYAMLYKTHDNCRNFSGVGERVGKEGDEQDDAQEEEEIDAEDAPVKIARDPGDPTPGERERHNATHIPHRSWCLVCVKGKGKEESHRRQKRGDESCKPHLWIDYKTFGEEGDYDDKATVLVCKDEITKMKFAHICERKGD